jgi:hypothetical protein
MIDENAYSMIAVGQLVTGVTINITRESVRAFAEASLDFNGRSAILFGWRRMTTDREVFSLWQRPGQNTA